MEIEVDFWYKIRFFFRNGFWPTEETVYYIKKLYSYYTEDEINAKSKS